MNNIGNYWNGGFSNDISRVGVSSGSPKLPYPIAYHRFEGNGNNDIGDGIGVDTYLDFTITPEYGNSGLIGGCLIGGAGITSGSLGSFSSWAISGWLKSVGLGTEVGQLSLISARRVTGQLLCSAILMSDGLGGEYISFSGLQTISNVCIADNKVWTHICMSKDSSTSSISFYVNGKLIGVASSSQLFSRVQVNTNISESGINKSYIDEVAVFDTPLTQFQILQLYNDGLGFNPIS